MQTKTLSWYYYILLFDVINSDFRKKFFTILKKGCTILNFQFIIGMYFKKNTEGLVMFNKIKEECGVFGIYSSMPERLAYVTCVGLSGLQHRGEESCRYCS